MYRANEVYMKGNEDAMRIRLDFQHRAMTELKLLSRGVEMIC